MALALVELREPPVIERFARRDLPLHIYEVGDLDPFFWPRTRWWGLVEEGSPELRALALLYDGSDPPTLLALGRDDGGAVGELLAQVSAYLPARVYAHLSPGLSEHLAPRHRADTPERHLKMVLRDHAPVHDLKGDDVVALSDADVQDIQALVDRAYPGNWFDARVLATGQYYGIRQQGELMCVAGVHVYSTQYRVAALGNVTTDPRRRGLGLARRATARLCRSLLDAGIQTIGLNVHADNGAAIRVYERLGFRTAAEYDEVLLTAR
jgi:ribosomal protein S18 acetylase RimI-like enzyme